MSIREKITSILFGSKEEPPVQEEGGESLQPEPQEEAAPESSPFPAEELALIKLTAEHPLQQLYTIRRRERGGLPAPRLCLDEEGVLPPEVVKKEKSRLQGAVRTAAAFRLKSVQNQNKNAEKARQKKAAKGEDGEDPEKKPAGMDAHPWIFLSADKLFAWVMVFPPTGQGRELTRELLHQALEDQGIIYGLDERLADRLAHDEERYFHLFLIAQGKPAFDGKNGNIVDYVPRVVERVLQVDEYDQVDYTALNLIHNVEEGQEICHLIKPTEGEPGRTVLDEEIPAKSGKSVPLPKGKNTEISEDGVQLLASISGSVDFTGQVFQVKPVLEIGGDVDYSTGSINFLGDINIQGNILSGFTVQAGGNIHVGGVVEAGSSVEAGGDLVVVKGILGGGATTVRAKGSVFAKYVENAVICVRELLQTDCIIGSSVYCGGEVIVQSGRGKIMGGFVWAARRICASAVGSQSECKTTVVLGGRPCNYFERELVQREVNALEMEMEKLECQPDSPVRSSLLSKTRLKLTAAEMKMRKLEERLQRLQAEEGGRQDQGNERLECGVAYPGTKIRFGDEAIRLHQVHRHCVATKVHDEILLM